MIQTNNSQSVRHKEFANDVIIPEIARLLDEGHSVTLTLRGVSMRPFLRMDATRQYSLSPASP